MECVIQLSLARGVELAPEGDDLKVKPPDSACWPTLTLKELLKGTRAAVLALGEGRITAGSLYSMVLQHDGFKGLPRWKHYEAQLMRFNLISRTVVLDGVPLAMLEPISPLMVYADVKAEVPYRLSRFALVRNDERSDGMLLECPRGHGQVRLLSALAHRAIFELKRPQTVKSLAEAIPELGVEGSAALLNLLAAAEAVLDPEARDKEDHDPELAPWAFHDMLFHAQSRMGRKVEKYGGLDPFDGKLKPPPVIKPQMIAGEAVSLFRPNLMKLKSMDAPFAHVLESRGSLRAQGEQPLNLQQLGEFLYRSARVRSVMADADISFRPYSGCGGIYPLEIYPVVHACDGLASGLYQYDPQEHSLALIQPPSQEMYNLLGVHMGTAVLDAMPQIVFIITARFQRAQIKYASVAYANILKDVGALYQTMYLVAESMSLAPVALGGGYADLFGKLAGLSYFAESSVGEFILGSRPSSAPPMRPPTSAANC